MVQAARLVQQGFWWMPEWCQRSLPLVWRKKDGGYDAHDGYVPYDRANAGFTPAEVAARAYATRMIEGGYLSQDVRTVRMERRLRRMRYDDALVFASWRLELLYIGSGLPHFRLYDGARVFGVARIYTSHADLGRSGNLEEMRRLLAAYLVFWRWTAERAQYVPHGAQTPLCATTDHEYALVTAKAERHRAVLYDALRDEED